MDLSSTYLGLRLRSPIIAGAGPLTNAADSAKRLEDAGVGAIVMPSLFEEQIDAEALATAAALEAHMDSFGEAISFMPEPEEYRIGPHDYLERVGRIKKSVEVPVIGSLNGCTRGGWLSYAKNMEQAGVDALELNVYYVPTDGDESSEQIERHVREMVREVRNGVEIPVAVKLSPCYTSLANFGLRLQEAGASGLVLFNRFFEPDVDIEELDTVSELRLSEPVELLLRLRWVAILRGHLAASLAVTGGVHSAADVIKSIMCGADAVQMVSELLRHGAERVSAILDEVGIWAEERGYANLDEMRGSMSMQRCPDPSAFERGNYIHLLQTWGRR
ncbi:MAG: dihydroorotate dehydrogenase-like protein [Leptolyngbya sp. PLA3]|nr:MAG: dihydroorotate dehydrogenase-like protein [Cyanobacteria bacterium CYA]MCE7969367.1 dihydroorotate dehydrogenase-like protein [Leptolyngbya sp. PL-A3]